MKHDLSRLLRPESVAVIGGGSWCRQVLRQLQLMAFQGPVWRVHPRPDAVEGIAAVACVEELPDAPDAVFVGVNRQQTVEVVSRLAAMGAGGAVCFASGFAEALSEDAHAGGLQADLVAAAGRMPFLGPNCYGYINALEGVLLWPDQHGCNRVDRGVAILTQSSNIAINLTMQRRSVPVACVVTCGNMAQTSQADIAMALLDDPRITAIGLHVEGFGDVAAWHALAVAAHERGVPLVAVKAGASEQAQRATVSHTASLAGSDAGADAVLGHLGIPRLSDLPSFLETLKLLHFTGPMTTAALSSVSCSGGEASLMADAAVGRDIYFPPLTDQQEIEIRDALGPMVSLSNPLDYNTYIWGDESKMANAWLPMAAAHIGLAMIVIDYPNTDATDWKSATSAAISVGARGKCPVAVVSTLPELLPPEIAHTLGAGGVVPLQGIREAMEAVQATLSIRTPRPEPPLSPGPPREVSVMTEAAAKAMLKGFGMAIPRHVKGSDPSELASLSKNLRAPLVLKAEGLAHKSESGGVKLDLDHAGLADAAGEIDADAFLVEEMVGGCVLELLAGITRDQAHGYVLSVAAGGITAELLDDRVSLLVPAAREDIAQAMTRLRIYPLIAGYRGRPAADLNAILDAVMVLQDCVIAQADRISEIEVNPLICTSRRAVAADALVVIAPEIT